MTKHNNNITIHKTQPFVTCYVYQYENCIKIAKLLHNTVLSLHCSRNEYVDNLFTLISVHSRIISAITVSLVLSLYMYIYHTITQMIVCALRNVWSWFTFMAFWQTCLSRRTYIYLIHATKHVRVKSPSVAAWWSHHSNSQPSDNPLTIDHFQHSYMNGLWIFLCVYNINKKYNNVYKKLKI